MFKKFTILFLLAASCIIYLPTQAAAYAPGEKTNSVAGLATENTVLQQRRGRGRGNVVWIDRRGRRRNGSWYGYRNYGQYRRTQVGNRRYRSVRSYVWRDGRRVSIWRRIFY
jgi:hypothetical protein